MAKNTIKEIQELDKKSKEQNLENKRVLRQLIEKAGTVVTSNNGVVTGIYEQDVRSEKTPLIILENCDLADVLDS